MRMKSRRPSHAATIPIAAQSIQDGKNEPMILIVGPIAITCIYERPPRDLPPKRSKGIRSWPAVYSFAFVFFAPASGED